jgi:ribosomal protein S20
MKTTKNFYKTPKPKSHRQNSRNNVRNGSRSERMRTINNRTYFSGIMSIPLREKY